MELLAQEILALLATVAPVEMRDLLEIPELVVMREIKATPEMLAMVAMVAVVVTREVAATAAPVDVMAVKVIEAMEEVLAEVMPPRPAHFSSSRANFEVSKWSHDFKNVAWCW